MEQITTTLQALKKQNPCRSGWKKLLTYLDKTRADNKPLPLITILDANGLNDALWALRCVPEHNVLWRSYAVWCVQQIQHLLVDPRSINALSVTQRHIDDLVTDEELLEAKYAASDVASDAASNITSDTTSITAYAATYAVVYAATYVDTYIASAVASAVAYSASAASDPSAAKKAQEDKLRQIFTTRDL